MKNSLKFGVNKLWILSAGLVAMGSVASASVIACAGVSNVVTATPVSLAVGSGNQCQVSPAPMLFSNFAVTATGGASGATVGISSDPTGTGDFGGDVDLEFTLNGVNVNSGNPTGDIQLSYEVTGEAVQGLDMELTATPFQSGGEITITEKACSIAFTGGSCEGGTSYANFSVESTGNAAFAAATLTPGPENPVYIFKDISFNGATTSEFTNSHAVPEPMTLSLLGAGLLGLGLLGRRIRK